MSIENGVLIGDKHTYRDFRMLLEKKDLEPPEPKYIDVDLPGADGSIDLSEVLTGDVKYGKRKVTLEFNLVGEENRWSMVYSSIKNYLHGQKKKVIFDDDQSFYYMGRLKVNEWLSNQDTASIVIQGDLEPYKYDLQSSAEPWEWDPFCFETGIINQFFDLEVDGELEIEIYGRRKRVVPAITVSNAMEVVIDHKTYKLQAGTSKILDFEIKEGLNTVLFIGEGIVTIDYRGGSL